ncbi:MAG: hypothetical protein ACE5E8_05105 [Acidimicrobiia bacterium]
MTDDYDAASTALPFADRLPAYLASFAIGLAVTVITGFAVGAVTDAGVGDAVSYTVILYGVLLLLIGGATGGGYTNLGLGAVEAMVGGRNRVDEDTSDRNVRLGKRPTRDPMERLRKGLRPQANPDAFWKVIGGFAYVSVGMALLTLLT